MNVLIVFASRYSQTEKIANRIGDVFKSQDWKVDVCAIEHTGQAVSLVSYDLVLIGSPIYVQKHDRKIRKFILDHCDQLNSMNSAFFSVCLAVGGTDKSKSAAAELVSQFLAKTKFEPVHVAQFAGSLMYQEYNWFVRWIMRWIVSQEGGDTDTSRNYEYTDWEQVELFANQLMELASQPRARHQNVKTAGG